VPRLLPFLIFLAVALTLVGGCTITSGSASSGTCTCRIHGCAFSPWRSLPPRSRCRDADRGAAPASAAVRPAIWIAFIWMGVGFLLVAFLGIADAGRLVAFLIARMRGPSDPDPARRVLLARSLAAGVGGVVAGLSALGLRSALAGVQIKELDIKLRGLPRELAGLRLVQISACTSGLCCARTGSHTSWNGSARSHRTWSPSPVTWSTGACTSCASTWLPWRGSMRPAACTSSPAITSTTRAWRNGTRTCRRSASARCATSVWRSRPGSTSRASRIRPARRTLRGTGGRDPSRALVLLAHQPRQFPEAARLGVPLTLCGHTHGGQIWPFSWIVALAQPYLAGLYRRGDAQFT